MENVPNLPPQIITAYNLKQALFSIAIGLAITLVGELASLAIHWLQNLPAEGIGGFAGAVRYWTKWQYHHYV